MSFTAKIQADIDNFQTNLDRAQARMDRFSKDIGAKVAKLGSTFQKLGGVVSVGITAPLTAAGVAAFNMATDFEDALGATDEVFQESSASIKDWANNLETYYGVAKKEALEYSNMMGTMLTNIGGLSRKEAAETSQNLVQLAGDLTAMYGGRVSESVNALTGALRGNNVMLTRYGIAINEAMIQAKALEMGLVSTGKEMDLTSKQAATLALIYEQSSAAQGQAAREADGASGSMRAFRTEITNLSTEIGMVLLPVVTPLINRLKEIVQGFRGLSPETQKVIVAVSGVAAALGPLLLGLGTLMKMAPLIGTAFAAMTGPIGIAIAAVAGAAALIIKNWDSIRAYFTTGAGGKLWSSISEAANQLWQRLSTIFGAIRDFVIGVWDKIGKNVIAHAQNAFNIVLSVVDGVMRHLTGVFDAFAALLRGDFRGVLEATKGMFVNIFETLKSVVTNTVAAMSQQLAGFLKLIGADGLGKALENFANKLTPARIEIEKTAKAAEEVTEAVQSKSTAIKEVIPVLDEAKESTKDYRAEMVSLFASWGLYAYQVENLSNQFKAIRDNARDAGASIEEMATIDARELGQKLALDLNQFSLTSAGSGLTGLSGGLNIPVSLNVDNESTQAGISNLIAKAQEAAAEINRVISEGISNSIVDLADSIGNAIGSGGNVLQAVGASLLGSLGTILKQLGKMAIQTGVGIEAVKKALQTLQGPIAIAAGVALVALGSAFSAGATNLGKSMGSASGGGYQSSSLSSSSGYNGELWRGALYNNDKQVVELKLHNTELRGALNLENNRNKRLG